MSCKKIVECDKAIKKIEMNPQQNIVLLTEDRKMRILKVDWTKRSVKSIEVKHGFYDYFCSNCFEISFAEEQSLDR